MLAASVFERFHESHFEMLAGKQDKRVLLIYQFSKEGLIGLCKVSFETAKRKYSTCPLGESSQLLLLILAEFRGRLCLTDKNVNTLAAKLGTKDCKISFMGRFPVLIVETRHEIHTRTEIHL